MAPKKLGTVTHYYDKIRVAIVELSATIRVGDTVRFQRHDEGFEQPVTSMQIEHEPVTVAKKGDIIGMKVEKDVKEGTTVLPAGAAAAPAPKKTHPVKARPSAARKKKPARRAKQAPKKTKKTRR